MSQDQPSQPSQPTTGAEGEVSRNTKLPFEPKPDDDTALGDTDQHSKVTSDGPTPEQERARQDASPSDD